jgi:hypothetical protein
MFQDYLSEDMEEDTIGVMSDGDTGYCVPWAVFADSNRKLWINKTYTVHGFSGGTVQLRIRRIGDRYFIDNHSIKKCHHKWTPGDPHYVGQIESDFAPVSIDLGGF